MKAKAVLVNTEFLPNWKAIEATLNSRTFAIDIQEHVLGPCLRSPEPGPAEFYLQFCDHAVSGADGPGVEVRLTGVSGPEIATRRSRDDYPAALKALTRLYHIMIAMLLPVLDPAINGDS